jgi:hypothetical protein
MNKVYILQENSTRDGLNFDYFCKDKDSLRELAIKTFKNRFIYPDNIKVKSFKFNDIGDIQIEYFDKDTNETDFFKNYSYIKITVK